MPYEAPGIDSLLWGGIAFVAGLVFWFLIWLIASREERRLNKQKQAELQEATERWYEEKSREHGSAL